MKPREFKIGGKARFRGDMVTSTGRLGLHWAPEAGDSTNYKSSVKIYSDIEMG